MECSPFTTYISIQLTTNQECIQRQYKAVIDYAMPDKTIGDKNLPLIPRLI